MQKIKTTQENHTKFFKKNQKQQKTKKEKSR